MARIFVYLHVFSDYKFSTSDCFGYFSSSCQENNVPTGVMCFQTGINWEGVEELDFLRDFVLYNSAIYKRFVVMHQARIHIVLESKTMQAHYINK